MTADEIRRRLNTIVDPCSIAAGAPAGLVDMGLVREVTIREGSDGTTVRVRIGLTEPGCMIGASFLVRARECLEPLAGIDHLDVQLQHDCDWTPNDMDPDYARDLGDRRAAQRASRQRGPGLPGDASRQRSD
jgi:metal-sulfur cluster biosynthetic enzyme